MAKGPKMTDETLIQRIFGNAKTFTKGNYGESNLEDYIRAISIVDTQDAIRRYKWENIPCSMSSGEIEKMLYIKGDLCFFYDKDLDEFFMMPYALNGTIDHLGRYVTVTPIPIAFDGKQEDKKSPLLKYFGAKKLKVRYDVLSGEVTEDDLYNSCVILHDYSNNILVQNTTSPRKDIQNPIIRLEASMLPYAETNLISGTGVMGVKADGGDSAQNLIQAGKSIRDASLNHSLVVPFVTPLEPTQIKSESRANSEEYLLAMQSMDNLRLSFLGLENGGLFEKKAHMLQAEQDANQANVGIVYQDGLSLRQDFCNIVNSIWGLDMYCSPSEAVLGIDDDGDGRAYDDDTYEDDEVVENEE